MKKRNILLLSLLFAGFCSYAMEQAEPVWRKSFTGKINWQKVTSYGNLIISTEGGLYGLDPENGDLIWEKMHFPALPESSFQEVANAPFFSLQLPDRMVMIDMFEGVEVFDSQKAGVTDILSTDFLYQCGGILVAGKPAPSADPILLMVNMADGEVLWRLEEKIGRVVAIEELSDTEILIVTLFTNYKIKFRNGEIIWQNSTSAEAESMKDSKLGSFMMALAEGMTGDMAIEIYFFQAPEQDMFVLGSTKEERMTGSETIVYKSTYSAFRLSDGSLFWKKPIEVAGKVGRLIFDTDGLIILPDDGSRTKINLFDYTTAEGRWGKKGRGITIKGGVYDYLHTDRGILLVSGGNGNNFLTLLDPVLGLLKFDKPVKIRGELTRSVSVSQGLLYVTTEELNILDPVSGSLVLSSSISTNPRLTVEDEKVIYAYDLKSSELLTIDKATSAVNVFSNNPVKFDGKEDPSVVEMTSEGVVLSSEQNIAMVDKSGNIAFQKYYPAPKEPGLKKALLYAQAVRAAYIGASSYYASAAFHSASTQTDDALGKELTRGLGQVYGEVGDAATDFVQESIRQASARHKATVSGRDYMFMLVDTETKDNALVLVNKKTGQIEEQVNLGKEKDPNYGVDDVAGQIYLQVKDSEIVSYKF